MPDLKKPILEILNGVSRIVTPIQAPIKNGAGKVTGYVTLHWSETLGYVSIPERDQDRSVEAFAEQLTDAYSTDRYGRDWTGCIRMLRQRGYNDREVEAIIRSKWTRWAGDMADHDRPYTEADLARYIDSLKPKARAKQLAEIVDYTFSE